MKTKSVFVFVDINRGRQKVTDSDHRQSRADGGNL